MYPFQFAEKHAMGRKLRRVALDFDWPLHKPWKGFVNPHYDHCRTCRACAGSGYSPAAKRLQDRWYGQAPFRPEERGSVPYAHSHPIVWAFAERNVRHSPEYYGTDPSAVEREARRLARHFNNSWSHHLNDDDVKALVDDERLWDLTRAYGPDGWGERKPGYPSAQEVNDWSLTGMGHDSINCHIVVKAECERLGIDRWCPDCGGEGSVWDSPEDKARADAWTDFEPDEGPGWQLWETVSEGSPISPVFSSAGELARWLANDEGSGAAGVAKWEQFLNGPGWAPSFAACQGGPIVDGVEAAVQLHDPERAG